MVAVQRKPPEEAPVRFRPDLPRHGGTGMHFSDVGVRKEVLVHTEHRCGVCLEAVLRSESGRGQDATVEELVADTKLLLAAAARVPTLRGKQVLKSHARDAHGLIVCDTCMRSRDVFTHEQRMYDSKVRRGERAAVRVRQLNPSPRA